MGFSRAVGSYINENKKYIVTGSGGDGDSDCCTEKFCLASAFSLGILMTAAFPITLWICNNNNCTKNAYITSGVVSAIGLATIFGICVRSICKYRKDVHKEYIPIEVRR